MKGGAIGDPAEKFRLRDMMIAVMLSICIIRPFRSGCTSFETITPEMLSEKPQGQAYTFHTK